MNLFAADSHSRASSLLSPDQCLEEIVEVWLLLSPRHGANLLHVGREEFGYSAVERRRRLYVRHQFIDADDPSGDRVNVFVKYSDIRPKIKYVHALETWLLGRPGTEFYTPRYYGQLTALERSIGAWVGVWEYIPKDATLTHLLRHQPVRTAVVKAAAAMTAMGEEARRAVPALPPTPIFIRPVAERLKRVASAADYFGLAKGVCVEQLSKLAALEQPAIAKLMDLGGYLTHNDLQPSNFLFRERAPLVIYDWESASLGAPGASLHFLTQIAESELLSAVDLYCQFLNSTGISVRPENVLFTLRAWSIFRLLDLHASDPKRRPDKLKGRLRWALSSVDLLRV